MPKEGDKMNKIKKEWVIYGMGVLTICMFFIH